MKSQYGRRTRHFVLAQQDHQRNILQIGRVVLRQYVHSVTCDAFSIENESRRARHGIRSVPRPFLRSRVPQQDTKSRLPSRS